MFLYIYFTKLAHKLRYIILNYCPNISYFTIVQIPQAYSMSPELITNYIHVQTKVSIQTKESLFGKVELCAIELIEIVQGN